MVVVSYNALTVFNIDKICVWHSGDQETICEVVAKCKAIQTFYACFQTCILVRFGIAFCQNSQEITQPDCHD